MPKVVAMVAAPRSSRVTGGEMGSKRADSGDHNAVASKRLRPIQRNVRSSDERINAGLLTARCTGVHADAHCDGDHLSQNQHGLRRDGFSNGFGEFSGSLHVGIGEHRQKLLPSIASE